MPIVKIYMPNISNTYNDEPFSCSSSKVDLLIIARAASTHLFKDGKPQTGETRVDGTVHHKGEVVKARLAGPPGMELKEEDDKAQDGVLVQEVEHHVRNPGQNRAATVGLSDAIYCACSSNRTCFNDPNPSLFSNPQAMRPFNDDWSRAPEEEIYMESVQQIFRELFQ
jgi:hypothetical protein